MTTAIRAAMADTMPKEFFLAACEDDEEGTAMYNLHRNRAESAKAGF